MARVSTVAHAVRSCTPRDCIADKEGADGADGGDDVATASPGAVEAFVGAFKRIVWSTYRRDMPPILATGGSVLTSDAGWGCMVRSGQMMVAEALVRHLMWGSQNDEERDVARVKVRCVGAVVPTLIRCAHRIGARARGRR